MEFRTQVEIRKAPFEIPPCEEMLFVGSCFADSMGRRFQEERFRATVNPYGVMYNPASVLHTVVRQSEAGKVPNVAVFTLGTNHVYVLKETGEIVDNCQKRPQNLFIERLLSVDECADYLLRAVEALRNVNPRVKVVFTVSPIRYRKYGYHESQLSKATLLLAVDRVVKAADRPDSSLTYFPAYEIVNDELRDYRFYKEDMLHPSEQAVAYIWDKFSEAYFGQATLDFLNEWKPLKEALAHRPFAPDSEEYRRFMDKTMLRVRALSEKYPNFALE
ncbi:GSCFA domain-containing protein [Prevotella sp. KH2C16]|uniref:GSCFA domain-containing protein n=1 Tax=Prevotella sp. KH2C16 TaxID=1855325 RepID=UPI0008EC3804|nr:GSCFA domain-containing protein [Prevotella sp. KH2C16]SFG41672.1 GSCFA family protein [Prevotella sp. KH2C16]